MTSPQNFTGSPTCSNSSDDEEWYTPPSSPVPMPRAHFPCTLVSTSNEQRNERVRQPDNFALPEQFRLLARTCVNGERNVQVNEQWNSVRPKPSHRSLDNERSQEPRSAFEFNRQNTVRPESSHVKRVTFFEDQSAVRPEPLRSPSSASNNVQRLLNGNGQLEMAHSVARLFPSSSPIQKTGKVALTPSLVESTLVIVKMDEKRKGGLAEDMSLNTNYADLELPTGAKEIGDLLDLFVLAVANYPPGISKTERKQFVPTRKEIAQAMMRTGLMQAACDTFILDTSAQIKAGTISDQMIRTAAFAIELILKAFLLMDEHYIKDGEVVRQWQLVETAVFKELPAQFWRTISFDYFESLCNLTAQITDSDPAFYKDMVRALMNGMPFQRKPRTKKGKGSASEMNNHPFSP